MRTPVYVELHQTGEKLAWGQTGPLGGSRLPRLSLFLSPSVAIYFSWQKKQLWDQGCQTFFFVPQQMRYMGIKKERRKANNNLQTQLSKSILYCNNNI